MLYKSRCILCRPLNENCNGMSATFTFNKTFFIGFHEAKLSVYNNQVGYVSMLNNNIILHGVYQHINFAFVLRK